jgi:CBS domain-containing protein
MTADPLVCTPDTTLVDAAHLLWASDCGMLPVVESERSREVSDR